MEEGSGCDGGRIRLMNFVSEEQLDESKKTRGERVEDGTAQRDRPLFQILKENKEKRDAEFNERFKHRPPKALDEDETEFLDQLETSRREYEKQLADQEAQHLHSFQAAVAAHSTIMLPQPKDTTPPPQPQPKASLGTKNPLTPPLGMIIKLKPQLKKPRIQPTSPQKDCSLVEASDANAESAKTPHAVTDVSHEAAKTGLVSYSDESDDEY